MKKRVIALAAAATLLAACSSGNTQTGGEGGSQEAQIAILTPYLANATTKEVIDLFQTDAKAAGWKTSVVDTNSDMNKLTSAFQDAVVQKPDAIVLGMGDPTQISLGLQAAQDAGIPVFAIDAAVADGIVANVTSDNADLGEQSAKALIEAIGSSGTVVMLTHDPHPGVRARAEAAAAAFEAAGITVLQKIHVDVPGPVDNARTITQDLISSSAGNFAGIWAGWDEPALGATQALDAASVTDVKVVGVDGQPFAVEQIEAGGPFVATVKQDWQAISTKITELISAYLQDGTLPEGEQIELPGQVITK